MASRDSGALCMASRDSGASIYMASRNSGVLRMASRDSAILLVSGKWCIELLGPAVHVTTVTGASSHMWCPHIHCIQCGGGAGCRHLHSVWGWGWVQTSAFSVAGCRHLCIQCGGGAGCARAAACSWITRHS